MLAEIGLGTPETPLWTKTRFAICERLHVYIHIADLASDMEGSVALWLVILLGCLAWNTWRCAFIFVQTTWCALHWFWRAVVSYVRTDNKPWTCLVVDNIRYVGTLPADRQQSIGRMPTRKNTRLTGYCRFLSPAAVLILSSVTGATKASLPHPLFYNCDLIVIEWACLTGFNKNGPSSSWCDEQSGKIFIGLSW